MGPSRLLRSEHPFRTVLPEVIPSALLRMLDYNIEETYALARRFRVKLNIDKRCLNLIFGFLRSARGQYHEEEAKHNLTKLALLTGFVVLGGAANATTIPSTISSTLTITTNSKLTTNVSCAVPAGAACIQFGASNITLNLSGFTMKGTAPSSASCTPNGGQNGIDTNGKNNAAVRGPGLVTQFNGLGIVVSGNNSSVEGVAMTSICSEAITVSGSYNEIEGNSISRAVANPNIGAGVITLVGNGNRILHNEVGAVGGTASPGINVVSAGNLIEENNPSGNTFAGIAIAPGSTGNVVRHNHALGNGADIIDTNAAGLNTYDNNLCQTSLGAATCHLPNIAGHSNFEPDGD
jgi:parallel beta-helix repeat protein